MCVVLLCVSIGLFISLAQNQLLGPGRYKIKDFIEDINSRSSSQRGICETRASRFQGENKV